MSASSNAQPLRFAVDDASAGQVVRAQLKLDGVARQDADEVTTHFSGDVRQHHVPALELNAEHRVLQRLGHSSNYFNSFFFRQNGRSGSGYRREAQERGLHDTPGEWAPL